MDRTQARNSFHSGNSGLHFLYRKILVTKGDEIFDIEEKKTKDYNQEPFLISNKAQLPSNTKNIKHDFSVIIWRRLENCAVTTQESYVNSFQYKVPNSILYTNTKLFKIGYLQHDPFWKNIEQYYLTIAKEFHAMCLRNVIIGITLSCHLLNYLILIGKLYLWACRKSQVLPKIEGFKFKIRIKCQAEKYISTRNNKLETFNEKWPKDLSPF